MVGDIHENGLDTAPTPTVYVNLFQRPRATITLTMLSDTETQSVTSAARRDPAGTRSGVPAKFRTFSEVYLVRSGHAGIQRYSHRLLWDRCAGASHRGVFGVMAFPSVGARASWVRVALGVGSREGLGDDLG